MAKSRFTRILIGIIAHSSSKYLKRRIKDYPGVPYEPLKMTKIADKASRMKNRILLKIFSSLSSYPNLFPAYLEFKEIFVY